MSEENRGAAISEDGISNAINKLLENPELISMVASALGKSAPLGVGATGDGQGEKITSTADDAKESETAVSSSASVPSINADAVAALMPMLSGLGKISGSDGKAGAKFRHEELLCALKPYLSNSRCEAIDYILRISRMSGIINRLR